MSMCGMMMNTPTPAITSGMPSRLVSERVRCGVFFSCSMDLARALIWALLRVSSGVSISCMMPIFCSSAGSLACASTVPSPLKSLMRVRTFSIDLVYLYLETLAPVSSTHWRMFSCRFLRQSEPLSLTTKKRVPVLSNSRLNASSIASQPVVFFLVRSGIV